jgi:hypothetical protein
VCGTPELQMFIQEIVNAIQAEIDALVQEKADLHRRRRNLWRRLQACEIGPNLSRCSNIHRSKRERSAVGRAMASKSRHLYAGLHRACRIAIMETGENPSAEEIYIQIVRRGSFNFDDLQENSISAIARTLSAYATGRRQRVSSIPALLEDIKRG